jgi:hypothetical protein
MIFAMVFTISCSGEDGKNGKDGKGDCFIVENGDDFDIECSGRIVGTLSGAPGEDGTDGEPGEDGEDGQDGSNCIIGNKTNGSYPILCGPEGKETVEGLLGGCMVAGEIGNEFSARLTCGTNEINICNGKILSPDKYCAINGTAQNIGDAVKLYAPCEDGKTYNSNTHYCGFAKKGDTKSTPLPLCKGSGKDGDGYKVDDLYNSTSGKAEKQSRPNYEKWEDEYCSFTSDSTAWAVAVSEEISSSNPCGNAKLNENSWKGQYCGFASATATVKTVVSGLCDIGATGPNQIMFAYGYCQVKWNAETGKPEKKTEYVDSEEDFCLKDADGKAIRKEAASRINEGTWKKQYCGWKDEKAKTQTVIVAANDTCATVGLNSGSLPETAADVEYCQWSYSDATYIAASPSQNDCEAKLNEDGPQKQYCGFASNTAAKATLIVAANDSCAALSINSGKPETAADLEFCQWDYASGKVQIAKPADNPCKAKFNENEPKKEFCGYASATAASPTVIAAASDSCAKLNPNAEKPESPAELEYCRWNYETKALVLAKLSENPCGAKLNENEAKKQYCGYASNTAATPTVIAAANDSCALVGLNETKPETAADVEYCQVDANEIYSKAKPGDTECGGANGAGRLNQDEWKGQFCYTGDSKVGVCAAGQIADETKKSTDEEELRCRFE